ncbi:hypothetical protein EVAR_17183_1 [Eumeta japonica]|uniref:(+)RNA virus helicase C-terminal domain-containing protein n=1 Tax=Eumeta variegata TaxID=151549 RepID=A0A4C1U934_EUMVA|nr:hypothetical protein EVAR_17183_1 [Eumeta japonica]
MVKTVTKHKASGEAREVWVVPNMTWVDEVLGCGKTTWIVKHFELGRDVVITTTREVTSKKSWLADWKPTQAAKLNLFEMQYIRPNLVATVTKELLCTYRARWM